MTPEQRLADAEATVDRAEILYRAIWKETERQQNEALHAYDAARVEYKAARDALAEKS